MNMQTLKDVQTRVDARLHELEELIRLDPIHMHGH
jgi:hypothetical protein